MFTLTDWRAQLLEFSYTTEETPFGPDVFVYKVHGKVFALLAWQATPLQFSFKATPLEGQFLRSQYPCITPGYHLNKQHWNTIVLDGTLTDAEITRLLARSYELVFAKLPKAKRLTG